MMVQVIRVFLNCHVLSLIFSETCIRFFKNPVLVEGTFFNTICLMR